MAVFQTIAVITLLLPLPSSTFIPGISLYQFEPPVREAVYRAAVFEEMVLPSSISVNGRFGFSPMPMLIAMFLVTVSPVCALISKVLVLMVKIGLTVLPIRSIFTGRVPVTLLFTKVNVLMGFAFAPEPSVSSRHQMGLELLASV